MGPISGIAARAGFSRGPAALLRGLELQNPGFARVPDLLGDRCGYRDGLPDYCDGAGN